MTLFVILFAILIVGPFSFVCSKGILLENELGQVIFANVLFRHGDRTPIDPYPNDPYKNVSYWPVGFGQLTNTGKAQQYELGRWLRRRYDPLLTDMYNNEVVYVQSTDVDRTLMSAESNLAGMFPPKGSQVWNPSLDWQPIPVHTIPGHLDKVLAAKFPCPAYEQEMNRVLNSEEMQELNKKYTDVYRILNEYTGKNITKLEDIEYVYNTLYIESLYNLTLPSWSKGIFPEPLAEASKYSFAIPTWTQKLARLKSGLLVQDMISHLQHKLEKKHKPKYNVWIYSAHDSTIANLLNTLGVFDLQNPPYASAVLMELRVDSAGAHQVILFFRNSTVQEPYLLTLPGCTPACPLDQFISLCQKMIPQDWDAECKTSSLFGITPDLPYNNITVAALLVSALLIVVLVASMVFYWQKRKRPTHCRGYSHMSVIPWDRYIVGSKLQAEGPAIWTGQHL